MVDHNGMCNEEGNEIGHSSKVLVEYSELVVSIERIDVAASDCIVKKIDSNRFKRIYTLPYNIVLSNNHGIWKRLIDKIKLFINIHTVFKISDYDIIWFYKVDFFLTLYMFFTRWQKRKSKIIGLVYQLEFDTPFSKMINWLYKTGLTAFDGIIYTQKKSKPKIENILYMPDYYYIPQLYDRFQSLHKEEKVVCVGTMNYYKELEQLVVCFNQLNYPLNICGYFADKEILQRIRQTAKPNITIRDAILEKDEYYSLIGTAKYTILPYNMRQYKGRTSGVLYEAVFLKSIPIAPTELLVCNEIEGISYDSWEQLLHKIPCYIDKRKTIENMNSNYTQYTGEILEKNIRLFFEEIANE